ncbi:MAG: hypothetical protein IK117_10510, partial [Bacteroidales bacterium]|nr:hypothetical protein [Bacteroidales bacterium]
MENMIPLNGRIAIVDDKIEQALPLMRIFSKNNIPYTFYDGNDSDSFPEKPENDIRILFLDLNLLGGKVQRPKEIRSSLINTLRHLLSPENYPYILILWSRQESEYKEVVEDIFKNELKDRAPITIKPYVKSVFFPNFADDIDNTQDKQIILDEFKKILAELPAYSYLLQWENQVHNSADETIGDVFRDYHSCENWKGNANCILEMLAKSYLEQSYENVTLETKTKASMLLLNDVLYDCLENRINNNLFGSTEELTHSISDKEAENVAYKINHRLLLSNVFDDIKQPGCVFKYFSSKKYKAHFEEILNDSCTCSDNVKKNMIATMIPCEVVVTPACDYAQKKNKTNRLVQGLLIESKHVIGNNNKIKNIDNRTDAIYISPVFEYKNKYYVLVLNFRYFVTD